MKTVRSSSLATLVAGLVLVVALARAGEPTFTYVELGTLSGLESVGNGLNDSNQVVGWSNISGCTVNGHQCRRAFLWDDGVMTDLGLLAGDEESVARAINNVGLIVGTSERNVVAGSGTFASFSYATGTMSALPDLGTPGSTFALDVNNSGLIAGSAIDPSTTRDSTVTWLSGAISNIGSTEPHSYKRGNGVNDTGELVGIGWNLFQPNDAMLFSGASWSTIGGEAGPFQNAEAFDINSSGVAVGLQAFPSGSWHPAMWTPGVPGGSDLGVLPGHDIGELFDINEAGWAVGRTWLDIDPASSRAVFFDGTTLHDLNDFLPAGSGAVLFEAREVNEQGNIVGTAVVNGLFTAFLMTLDGPWADLGHGLAGTAGEPELVGTGDLTTGSPVSVELTNALGNAPAFLFLGLAELNFAPFYGGTLVPDFLTPPGQFLIVVTNGSGEVTLGTTWPVAIPSGFEVYLQYWIDDAGGPFGFAASNAIRGTTP